MALQFQSSDEHNYQSDLKYDICTENWMSSLPNRLHNLPLSKLAIPGTHDSGTFCNSTTLSQDLDKYLKLLAYLSKLPLIGSCVQNIILRWSQCQNLDFTRQLHAGIRYFDLRVEATPGSGADRFYLVHQVLGPKVTDMVEDVSTFLEKHNQEIVLLDFNHFYGFESKDDHLQLINYLISKLQSKICNECDINELTLHNLWSKGKQVIIFYQDDVVHCVKEIWPKDRIDSFWAEADDPKTCIDRMSLWFSHPHAKDFTVCQGVLTPSASTIIKSIICNGSVYALSQTLLPLLCPWIENSTHLSHQFSIATVDFVENGDLIQTILKLNYKRPF